MNREHRDLLAGDPWIQYLEGSNPDFPEQALLADFDRLRHNLEVMRADTATPDTRLSDDMNHINPAVTENLNRLMLGGLPTGRTGGPLHCRLRYFDPDNRRAGIPADVAALVEKLTADAVTVTLVNTGPGIVATGDGARRRLRRAPVRGGHAERGRLSMWRTTVLRSTLHRAAAPAWRSAPIATRIRRRWRSRGEGERGPYSSSVRQHLRGQQGRAED